MKKLDIAAATLMIVGGLNWGLVAIARVRPRRSAGRARVRRDERGQPVDLRPRRRVSRLSDRPAARHPTALEPRSTGLHRLNVHQHRRHKRHDSRHQQGAVATRRGERTEPRRRGDIPRLASAAATSGARRNLGAALPYAVRPRVPIRLPRVLGLRMHVREAGAGEAVLLLHGLGVSGRYFMPLAGVLAARRHVIVPDLPGWGRSEQPPRPLGVGGAADLLAEFLHRRGRDAVAIVANSFGCQVALTLAQRRPELVGPLTLVGPTVDPRYRSWSVHAVRLALDSLREPPALWRILLADYARMGSRRLAATAQAALEVVLRTTLQGFGGRSSSCGVSATRSARSAGLPSAHRAQRGSFAQVARPHTPPTSHIRWWWRASSNRSSRNDPIASASSAGDSTIGTPRPG